MCCDDEKTSETMKNNKEEHKEQMWEKMMDCCCSEMTDEEKQVMMKDMHKMMHHIKECGGPVMGAMMGKMHNSIHQTHRVATLATPEVQGLFEDWVEQIEKELLDFLKDKKTVDVKDISGHFKISKDSAYYFLTKLAQKGKIKLSIKADKA